MLDRLRDGVDVALVSDGGTPAISDPGALLVRHPVDATRTFATVFGQYLEAEPGQLRVWVTRRPEQPDWPATVHRG